MTTLDYESIEIYLGDRLRRADCLDVHADHFFPVTLLDHIFHYSEEVNGSVSDGARVVHRNFHGHDFDRWIDNLVARTRLHITPAAEGHDVVELLDIDSMIFSEDSSVTVNLPDDTSHQLVDFSSGEPLRATSLDDLSVSIDLAGLFHRPPVDADSEPYMGFGMLAHVVRTVCDKSGIDPAAVDPAKLSDRIFDHFKNELLDLIPSLWNDMEHILHYCHPSLHARPGRA
ncbi:MAG: hypothetical protein K2I64_02645 [Muribaculaceae bacterium]|nr:hypothetical protein [Muribaculaceae bacterium]